MVRAHASTIMVRLLKNIVLKAHSLGVNWMWTRKDDHAPKSECAYSFNICQNMVFFRKIQVWPFSYLLLRLHLSSLLVKCVKDVACKSSHNNLQKHYAIYFVHIQCNLHVTCTLCCHYWKSLQKKNRNCFPFGSFDHLDLQSQNNYKYFFFILQLKFLNFLGHVMYRWKGIFKISPTIYYIPQNFRNFQLVDQKNKYALGFLSFIRPTLFGETCGYRFKG